MVKLLQLVADCPRRGVAPGDPVLEQWQVSAPMMVLIEGEVEILRDSIHVATVSEPGSVFGEMAALLGTACTATVRALKTSTFAVVENPEEFLRVTPVATLHVARMLAQRLDTLNRYLVDVKAQYEGHDHLGMVDEVLETLMHRQPRVDPSMTRAVT